MRPFLQSDSLLRGGTELLSGKEEWMKHQQRLKTAIIEVVENQVEANDPPEIKETLDRLVSEGYSSQESKELIGNVVVVEVFEVLKEGKPFDLDRYVAALRRLPEIPPLPGK
jgi:hypothetical protein